MLIITIAIGLGTLVVVILSLITTENAYGQEQEQEKQSDNKNNKLNLQGVNGNLSATENKVLAAEKITVKLTDGQTIKVRL